VHFYTCPLSRLNYDCLFTADLAFSRRILAVLADFDTKKRLLPLGFKPKCNTWFSE
jgi:hypothetical protein